MENNLKTKNQLKYQNRKEKKRQYYLQNREKIIERIKQRIAAKPKQKYNAEYYQKNRTRFREAQKRYQEKRKKAKPFKAKYRVFKVNAPCVQRVVEVIEVRFDS